MMARPLKTKRQQAEKHGRFAERLACILLILKGFHILDTRHKCKVGEIDIIAKRGQTLVFVEVKARKSVDDALYAIAYKQQKRIEAAAEEWLQKKKPAFKALRFDVIAVSGFWPHHIVDTWRPEA